MGEQRLSGVPQTRRRSSLKTKEGKKKEQIQFGASKTIDDLLLSMPATSSPSKPVDDLLASPNDKVIHEEKRDSNETKEVKTVSEEKPDANETKEAKTFGEERKKDDSGVDGEVTAWD